MCLLVHWVPCICCQLLFRLRTSWLLLWSGRCGLAPLCLGLRVCVLLLCEQHPTLVHHAGMGQVPLHHFKPLPKALLLRGGLVTLLHQVH